MGTRKICDNCDRLIKDGEKSLSLTVTIGTETVVDYADICEDCEQRIRTLADNSFKPTRKQRSKSSFETTES